MKQEEKSQLIFAAEEKIGYTFKNKDILFEALTHKTYANEAKGNKIPDNDRLEFLGDAVLDLVIAEILYRQYPDFDSGDMTKLRAALVNESALSELAKNKEYGELLLLGVGEQKSGGAEKPSVVSDFYEAITAAIYLDGGFEVVCDLIKSDMKTVLKNESKKVGGKDYKSLLQEYLAKRHLSLPFYSVTDKKGPDHDLEFVVECKIGSMLVVCGSGHSIKIAEQSAAEQALDEIVKQREKSDGQGI